MAPATKLPTIESALRTAITTGAYEQAELLLSSYSQELERALQNGVFQSDHLTEEISHTNNFLDWVLRMVSAARSHDAAHLRELLSAPSYRHPGADRLHSWQLDG